MLSKRGETGWGIFLTPVRIRSAPRPLSFVRLATHRRLQPPPYRTTDNRIEGVVLAFKDITERYRVEEQFRQAIEAAPNRRKRIGCAPAPPDRARARGRASPHRPRYT